MSSKSHALELLNFTHGFLTKVADAIPAEKAMFQPHPTANHLLWTLGHLALTYNWVSGMIDASGSTTPKFPENYNTLFGGPSKPSADASVYPSLAEVRKAYGDAFDAYLKLVQNLPESEVWSAPASDGGGFCSSKIDSAYKCAWHDGWHLGQLTDIRRALGLPPIM